MEYSGKNIQTLSGIEAIQHQPASYLNADNPVAHCIYELVSNAVDEYTNGYASKINVIWSSGDVFTVTDDGRGIPGDPINGGTMPAMEAIFTTKDTGGKFQKDSYQISGGTFGIGLTAVAALSVSLSAESVNGGHLNQLEMGNGKVLSFKRTRLSGKKVSNTGTSVTFKLDAGFFPPSTVSETQQLSVISEYLTIISVVSGAPITFEKDGKIILDTAKKKVTPGGMLTTLSGIPAWKPGAVYEAELTVGEDQKCSGKLILAENSLNTAKFPIFVNYSIPCSTGTPVYGLRDGVLDAISSRLEALPTDSPLAVKWKRIRELKPPVLNSFFGVMILSLGDPRYSSLTKTGLTNPVARTCARQLMLRCLEQMLGSNPGNLARVITNIYKLLPAKTSTSQRTNTSSTVLSDKLQSAAPGTSYDDTELWITEGDSASGHAKQVAGKHQAVLPMGGKPQGVWRLKSDDDITPRTQELIDIIRQHRNIVLMMDADPDGRHMAILLIGLILKKGKPDQRILIPKIPRFVILDGEGEARGYAHTDVEADKIRRGNPGCEISTIKGIGKIDPDEIGRIMRAEKQLLMDTIGQSNMVLARFYNGMPKGGTDEAVETTNRKRDRMRRNATGASDDKAVVRNDRSNGGDAGIKRPKQARKPGGDRKKTRVQQNDNTAPPNKPARRKKK